MKDQIELSSATRDGLNSLDMYDVQRVNSPEWMAWFVKLLKYVPDDEKVFPRGKWATIQSIEQQLEDCARETIERRKEKGDH